MAKTNLITKPTVKGRHPIDLTGQRFGRLLVVSFAGRTHHRFWNCVCDCGNTTVSEQYALTHGNAMSCGCLTREMVSKACTIHGQAWPRKTRVYAIWSAMLQRCSNPNCRLYKNYGGRGIRVCESWRTSFNSFQADIGTRPSRRHSIDRKDNDGHYSCGHCKECIEHNWPANCRWATVLQQAANTSTVRLITHNEQTLPMAEWSRLTGISVRTIGYRINAGWSIERALTTPGRPQ